MRTSSLYYFIALRCFGESDSGVVGGEGSEEGARRHSDTALPIVSVAIKGQGELEEITTMHSEDHKRLKSNDKQGYPLDVVEVRVFDTLAWSRSLLPRPNL